MGFELKYCQLAWDTFKDINLATSFLTEQKSKSALQSLNINKRKKKKWYITIILIWINMSFKVQALESYKISIMLKGVS